MPTDPRDDFITLEKLPSFLVETGLVRREAMVDDPFFDVQDRSRRNSNFGVKSSVDRPILIKQPRPGFQLGGGMTVEAKILRLVTEDPRLEGMRWFTPEFEFYDSDRGILAMEMVSPAASLLKYHLNAGEPAFPADTSRLVGYALADMHSALHQAREAGLLSFIPPERRDRFQWERSLLVNWDDLSQARKDFVNRIRDSPLIEKRDEMAARLSQNRAPCHNDARWDNILITTSDEDRLNLRIIDWETCSMADPAYDITYYLLDYMRFWLGTTRFGPSSDDIVREFFSLSDVHESVRAFTSGYLERRGLEGAAADDFMLRVAEYYPFALFSLAFEMTQKVQTIPVAVYRAIAEAEKAFADPGHLNRLLGLEVPVHV